MDSKSEGMLCRGHAKGQCRYKRTLGLHSDGCACQTEIRLRFTVDRYGNKSTFTGQLLRHRNLGNTTRAYYADSRRAHEHSRRPGESRLTLVVYVNGGNWYRFFKGIMSYGIADGGGVVGAVIEVCY